MTEIDSGTNSGTYPVGLSFIAVTILQGFFRREDLCQISFIWKSVRNVPFHICLTDIGKGITGKGMFLMPQQTALKIDEVPEQLRLLVGGKQRSVLIKIFRSAAFPGTFCHSQHVGIEIIFNNHLPLGADQPVIPDSQNGSCKVIASLFLIIYTAVVQCDDITEGIKMVQIMET